MKALFFLLGLIALYPGFCQPVLLLTPPPIAQLGAYSNVATDALHITANQAALPSAKRFVVSVYGEKPFLVKALSTFQLAVAQPVGGGAFGLQVAHAGDADYSTIKTGLAYGQLKKVVTIASLFFTLQLAAQQLPSGTEQQLEDLNEATEEENEDHSYLQQLQYYRVHPLNINTATAEDLQVFKLLTPLQIQTLLQYRNLFQNLISIYELQAVPLWDLTTIRKLLPYITINNNVQYIRARFTDGEHIFLMRNTR